jgi:hypothetical protein
VDAEEVDVVQRSLGCVLVTLAALLATSPVAPVASAAHFVPKAFRTPWLDRMCHSVSDGAPRHRLGWPDGGGLQIDKAVDRIATSAGLSTLRVTLTDQLDRTPAHVTVYDCVWIDGDGDGVLDPGEPLKAYTGFHIPVRTAAGGKHVVTFDILLRADEHASVCDRAYRFDHLARGPFRVFGSRQASTHAGRRSTWRLSWSPSVCTDSSGTDPDPPAEVPESSSTPMLAITGGATGAAALGALGWRRRRRR